MILRSPSKEIDFKLVKNKPAPCFTEIHEIDKDKNKVLNLKKYLINNVSELRMRDSYKRFVKTWIRFANPWIRIDS
jgi:hypothetical protein